AAHRHPRVEGDGVGHVGEARLHLHLVAPRVHTEHLHAAARGPEQVEQALDRRGLAGAVAAEEAVAAARRDAQAQAVDGVGARVAAHQVVDLDRRGLRIHGCHPFAARARACSNVSKRSSTRRTSSPRGTCRWCACTTASSTTCVSNSRRTVFLYGVSLARTKQPLPATVSITPWLSSSA